VLTAGRFAAVFSWVREPVVSVFDSEAAVPDAVAAKVRGPAHDPGAQVSPVLLATHAAVTASPPRVRGQRRMGVLLCLAARHGERPGLL
jgi:hypothetical protein